MVSGLDIIKPGRDTASGCSFSTSDANDGKERQRAEQSLVEQFEIGAAARQHLGSRQR